MPGHCATSPIGMLWSHECGCTVDTSNGGNYVELRHSSHGMNSCLGIVACSPWHLLTYYCTCTGGWSCTFAGATRLNIHTMKHCKNNQHSIVYEHVEHALLHMNT